MPHCGPTGSLFGSGFFLRVRCLETSIFALLFLLVLALLCVNLSMPLQGADVRGLTQTGQTQTPMGGRLGGHSEGAETQTTPLLLTQLIVVERFVPFCRKNHTPSLNAFGEGVSRIRQEGGLREGEGFRGHSTE